MTDTRNAHVAEPFRLTLNGFEDAMAKVATPAPRPLKAAFEMMLMKFAAMVPDVPRLSIDADPSEFEDVNDFICEAARAFDAWLLAVGREVQSNARRSIDLSDFTDVALNAIEGNATFQITRCAETVREDRNAA